MKKKLIIIGIIVFLIIVLGIISFPFVNQKLKVLKLENKVSLVNQLYKQKVDIKKVKKEIKQTKKNHSLEKDVLKYLNDLTNDYGSINTLLVGKEYKEFFNTANFSNKEELSGKVDTLKETSASLTKYQESIKELLTKKKQKTYITSGNQKKYLEIIKRLDSKSIEKYLKKIDDEKASIEKDVSTVQYLIDHKDNWDVVEESIEFKTRGSYDEFSKLEKSNRGSSFKNRLIADTTGPDIQASDITIYLNNSVSLDEKIHCVDAVDGEVTCDISGNYDNTKVGTYPISIHAVDQSKNTSEKTIQVKVIQYVNTKPYLIHVLRNQNVVIVYGLDSNGEYTQVVKVFVCSTGKDNATPTGTYSTTKGSTWGSLFGGVWGQYSTRIVGSILFHSVPYYTPDKGNLEWEEYNKLGTQASLGCVRLAVRDVKWIFYNCPAGTTVKIYDGELPSGIQKPSAIKIDGSSPNRGWDPTDDDPGNPWNS